MCNKGKEDKRANEDLKLHGYLLRMQMVQLENPENKVSETCRQNADSSKNSTTFRVQEGKEWQRTTE